MTREEIILRDTRSGQIHKGHLLPGGFRVPLEGDGLETEGELEQLDAMPPDPPVETLCRRCFFDQEKAQ